MRPKDDVLAILREKMEQAQTAVNLALRRDA